LKVAPKPHKHTMNGQSDLISVARSLARSIRQSSTHEESDTERKSSAGSRIAVAVVGPLSRTIAFSLTKSLYKIELFFNPSFLFSCLQEEFLHPQFVALTVVGILTFSEMIASSFCGRWKLEIEQEVRALGKEHANKRTAVKASFVRFFVFRV
jgi:Na+/proline symporter